MNWTEIKELLIKDGAVIVLGVLYHVIKFIDKLDKSTTTDIRFFKVKTKRYHVRLLMDGTYDSPCILARKRGFLKDWSLIEKKDIPECLVQDIFEPTCSNEKRKRLVNKMMELKAFW